MLSLAVTAGLVLLLVTPAVVVALVLEPYWQRAFRTPARQAELDRDETETWGSSNPVFVLMVLVFLGLPALFVIDGLVVRIDLLYNPRLSVFFPFDTYVQLAGVVLATLGLAILTVTARVLAEHVFSRAADEREMLTTGIYAVVRHPYYLGFILFATGLVCLTLNYLAIVLLFPALFETDGRFVTRVVADEERELVDRFGPEYEEYRQRTGRFVPKLR